MSTLSKAEQARRKDINQSGVAQEALDKLEELEADRKSSSEVFTEHGYSLSHVLKPAIKERARVVEELRTKPESEVVSDILDVAAVKSKFAIPDFVASKLSE